MKSAHSERRGRAAELLAGPKLDALLLTNLHNVRYLTGFTGSNAALLLYRSADAILYTDPRYTVQSKQQADCRIRVATGPLMKSIVTDVRRSRLRRLGFEADHMTAASLESLRKSAGARTTLEPTSGVVARLRMVKDAGEIERIRQSVNTNSRALDAALKHLKPGMTESQFAAEIDYRSRRLGADGPSFDTIVAAGTRAALPHARPGSTKIGPGILLIDMGASQDGYASDMTRMVHLGKASAKYRRAYTAVLEAQLAAIDAVRPGVKTSRVDSAARQVLRRHGLGKEFVHSTGHGLGLEIHELPRIGRKDDTLLDAGMAITIEPGIYIEGWGGIRIEDTVLVTEKGCEVLTPTTKELREV